MPLRHFPRLSCHFPADRMRMGSFEVPGADTRLHRPSALAAHHIAGTVTRLGGARGAWARWQVPGMRARKR
eukprot:1275283-Prymnesium_polylepis.2